MYTHAGAGWSIRPFTRNDRIPCLRIFRDCLRAFPWRGEWQAYLPVLQNAFASARVLVAEEASAGCGEDRGRQVPDAGCRRAEHRRTKSL